jgi:predicted nucleotidyltransferase
MYRPAVSRVAIPFCVRSYIETIIERCADGGRTLVSVVLFGSAAIGGWVEAVSDVDLILVVPDTATDEDIGRLGDEVKRIEILHRLRGDAADGQSLPEKLLNKLTAHDRGKRYSRSFRSRRFAVSTSSSHCLACFRYPCCPRRFFRCTPE